MNIEIKPARAAGVFTAPPSKSMAHRLLICAAVSKGESLITNIAPSRDILATLGCLESMGVSAAADFEKKRVLITGAGKSIRARSVLNCNESGSTLRFFIPLCLINGGGTLTGSEYLLSRPLSEYESLEGVSLIKSGGKIELSGVLKPGVFTLRGDISSQFISGLLFALPLLSGDSEIRLLCQHPLKPADTQQRSLLRCQCTYRMRSASCSWC